jgi:hypothetical protein
VYSVKRKLRISRYSVVYNVSPHTIVDFDQVYKKKNWNKKPLENQHNFVGSDQNQFIGPFLNLGASEKLLYSPNLQKLWFAPEGVVKLC